MFKSILIATDGSELAEKAVENGVALAKSLSAKITGLTVAPMFPHYMFDTGFSKSAEFDVQAQKQSRIALESVERKASAAGVPCQTIAVGSDHVHEAIIEAAEARGCDLIVMASHGRRGLKKFLLGSQASEVLTQSTVPILICR